jgi:hypothetical protein
MKCAIHAAEAIGVCVRCGKGVCAECPPSGVKLTCSPACAEVVAKSGGGWRIEVMSPGADSPGMWGIRQIQFSTKTLLITTFWAALFFTGVAVQDNFNGASGWTRTLGEVGYINLLIVPPAAAVGNFFKHARLGILCGAASAAAICLLELFAW